MKKSITSILLILFTLSLINCTKNSDEGSFTDPEKIIIETELISANYQANTKQIKFIIEDLLNTSDNSLDKFPDLDFLTLSVDINNNNLPDDNLDKVYSISNEGINCMSFILNSGGALTQCIEEEGYSYEVYFRASDKSAEEHIIYELIINKEHIFNDSETVGLIFNMKGDGAAGPIPNVSSLLFVETIEFSL